MIRCAEGALFVTGAITMQTAPSLREQGAALCGQLAGQDFATLDLSEVGAVDSAAVALLLHWARAASAAGLSLRVRHAPPTLRALVALYDLDAVLVLEAAPL